MAGLPENWEWDYDGNRWFYRYKPTGLIQYTFPKPGDEFPEFVDDSAPPPDLAPEEKLVSQQQIKRRSTLGQIPTRQSTATTHRERASSNAVSDPDDGSGPFWLQPDGLMYMGPGAYTDISPLQEEEEERGEESAKAGEEDVAGAPVPAPPTSVSNATESAGTPQPTRSQMSPIVSTETTPQVLNSNPATTTPELDSAVIIEVGESVAGDIGVVEQPEVHLLDGRQVPSNPIGFVAELASELTARCDDEINPAPVELPGNEQMMYTSDPGVYVNAFDLAPVELPSDESAAGPKIAGGTVEQKPLVPHASGQGQGEVQRLRSYQAAQELLKRPYEPVRQHSLPQPTSSANPGPTPGQYQPYNPVRHAVLGAAAANKYSIAETQHRQLAGDNKRHSLAGPVLSQPRPTEIPPALQAPQVPPKRPVDPSDIPPALQAPQVPSKRPLDGPDNGAYPTIVGAGGLPNTVSSLATSTNPSSLAHFPAVLQPARGRPIMRAQSPPLTQRASPARTYQPYKSYRDLQKDIDDTVQLLSQTEYGQGTTANPETSNPLRPQVSRTGTLPAHISALPFRTARPKLLHSAASDPVTMRNVQSRQPPPGEASASKPPGQDEVVPISQEYSAPLPPSSPDIPQPLKLSRKSLPPQNRVPTVASFSLPVTADPVSTFMDATPAPSNTPVLDTPANSTSSPEAAMHLGSSGVTGNTGGDAEQVGDTGNRKLPTASSPPHQGVELKRTKDTDQIVTSTGQQQATMQGPPEQPVASGFTVSAEPAALPAPHAAASRQHVPVTFDTSSQPAPSASSVVESTDEPPIATDSRIAPVLSNATPTSQSVTYPLVSLTDRQGAEANQEPARSTPVVVVQRTSQSVSSRAGFVNPDVVQSSSHVVIDYQPMVESSRQSSSQPSPTPPNDQSARAEVAPLLGTSSAPSPALGDKSCSSEPANDVDQAVTPPQPSVTPQPSGVQTSTPVYRASSPPTQQGNVPRNISSCSPLGDVTSSSQKSPAPTEHGVPKQAAVHSLTAGQAPLAAGSPDSHQEARPAASPTAPAYTLPSGHHPLSSSPVNVSEASLAELSRPKPEESGTIGSSDQQVSFGASGQSLPVAHPQPLPATQSNAADAQPAGESTQQRLPQPSPQNPDLGQGQTIPNLSPPFAQQVRRGTESSATSTSNQGQTSQPPMPQALPQAGQSQSTVPPAGQTPQLPPAQGKAAPLTFGPGQGSQTMPQRTFSYPVLSQPISLPHPGAPGSAPPQMPVMFSPPGMPHAVQPGMVPQHSVFPAGGIPQGMQLQPVHPQMMKPSQMLGGPAYVIQQAQPPQPVKEEKSWFGKLWRSESVKKPAAGHAVNSANKLQKSARPQAPPVFPPPLHPAVSQGTPTSPHMMYPFQQGQQALNPQQPSGPQFRQQHQHQQPLQHQQQHKPPLAWKTVNNSNGNGNGNGNRMPQFHAPNLNPNQSVLPPPEVRQAIQQQEQRLNPVRPESTGLGLAQAQAQAQSVDSIHRGGQHAASSVPVPVQVQGEGPRLVGQGQGQSHQGQSHGHDLITHQSRNGNENGAQTVVNSQDNNHGTGEAKAAPAAAAVGPGNAGASRWGNANASSGGYDGSGWGDDDEEDFS